MEIAARDFDTRGEKVEDFFAPVDPMGAARGTVELDFFAADRRWPRRSLPADFRISGHVLGANGQLAMYAAVRAMEEFGGMAASAHISDDGRLVLTEEDGSGILDLIATPPAVDGSFYNYAKVDSAWAGHLKGVAAETEGLVMTLPAR